MKYRFGGKEKRFTSGLYPEVGLAEAGEGGRAPRDKLVRPVADRHSLVHIETGHLAPELRQLLGMVSGAYFHSRLPAARRWRSGTTMRNHHILDFG